MKKAKDRTISSILLGDSLGDLVRRLDIGENETKLIVIVIGQRGIRLGIGEGISAAEAVGALYLGIDSIDRTL